MTALKAKQKAEKALRKAEKAPHKAEMSIKGYTKQAVKEGIAIERLLELRPQKVGASHNSIIYNTASRIGQLEYIRHARVLVLLDERKCA